MKKKNMPHTEIKTQTRTSVSTAEKIGILIAMAGGLALAAGIIGGVLLNASPDTNPEPAELRDTISLSLTDQLLQVNQEYQKSSGQTQTDLYQDLLTLSAERTDYLLSLAAEGNAELFEHVLTAAEIAGFPATIQTELEEYTAVDGVINIITYDDFETLTTETRIYVSENTSGEEYPLTVLGDHARLQSNDSISLTGVLLEETIYTQESNYTTTRETEGDALGTQKTLMIPAAFSDLGFDPAYDPNFYTSFFFGSAEPSIKGYINEYSYNRADVIGDVTGIQSLGFSEEYAGDKDDYMAFLMDAALDSEVDWFEPDGTTQRYDRIVIITPDNFQRSFSSVGKWNLQTPEGFIVASLSVVHEEEDFGLTLHEYGHALGLHHANHMDCYPEQYNPFYFQCGELGYGDRYDDMGQANNNHYNAALKSELGWLVEEEDVVVIENPGTYEVSLGNFEILDERVRAIKIIQDYRTNGDPYSWFYIERRQAIGADADLDSNVTDGILIHYDLYYTNWDGDSWTIAAVPEESYIPDQVAFLEGETFSALNQADDTETTITVNSVSEDEVSLTITLQRPYCEDGTLPGECNEDLGYCNPDTRLLEQNCDQCGYACPESRPYCILSKCRQNDKMYLNHDGYIHRNAEGEISVEDQGPDIKVGHYYQGFMRIDTFDYLGASAVELFFYKSVTQLDPGDLYLYRIPDYLPVFDEEDIDPSNATLIATLSLSDGWNSINLRPYLQPYAPNAFWLTADTVKNPPDPHDSIHFIRSTENTGYEPFVLINRTCSDGTPWGECNTTQHMCQDNQLVAGCGICGVGCPEGYFCKDLECCHKIGGSLHCSPIMLPNSFAL